MARKKRLFIAINLPENIKKDLELAVSEVQFKVDSSIRFTERTSWHLTLIFLGEQSDDDANLINQAMAEVAADFESPVIDFEKITYGPIGRTPRMIWLIAKRETSDFLLNIKKALERSLFENGITFEQEHRQFNAHITLARFTALNRESLPALELPFKKKFEAVKLELMESHLQRGGADYEPLSSFDFGGQKT